MFNRNPSFYKIAVISWFFLLFAVILDMNVFQVEGHWHFWAMRIGTLLSVFIIIIQARSKREESEELQFVFMILMYLNCAYGLVYIDQSYHYAFMEVFLLSGFFLTISFPVYLVCTGIGYLIFLISLFVSDDPTYLATDYTFKPFALFATTLVGISSVMIYQLLISYRREFSKLKKKLEALEPHHSIFKAEATSIIGMEEKKLEELSHSVDEPQKILDVLNISPEKFEESFEVFAWKDLITSVEKEFSSILGFRGVTFSAIGFEGEFTGNKNLLLQVLRLLVTNAFEGIVMTPQDRPEIVILMTQIPGLTTIRFINSHSAIAIEDLAKVFDPMFTTKNPRNHKGLGLTAVKKILEAHHGKIEVQSLNNSTVFSIALVTKI